MRIPLAPAGRREMAIITFVFGCLTALAVTLAVAGSGVAWWPVAALFALAWAGGLAFFRDPERVPPDDPEAMLAPADGTVVETALVDTHPDVGGPATRISIFLSIFSVHINRSPCRGVVRSVRYQPGRFLDARNPDSGVVNESNTVVIDPDPPLPPLSKGGDLGMQPPLDKGGSGGVEAGPVVVRQISGAIARRIVCAVQPGDHLEAGQRIGMIKFGSRTELILPGHTSYQSTVKVGDPVRAGISVMARRQTEKASSTLEHSWPEKRDRFVESA